MHEGRDTGVLEKTQTIQLTSASLCISLALPLSDSIAELKYTTLPLMVEDDIGKLLHDAFPKLRVGFTRVRFNREVLPLETSR